jgi:error-prone DNA polymerase
VHDYATTGLTLRSHPLALLRPHLAKRRLRTAAELHAMPNGRIVRYCGIVTLRQQPDTANGTIFISLEDETGIIQVIVWKRLREQQRPEVLRSRLLAVYGTWQREGDVMSLIAGQLQDLSPLLGRLATTSMRTSGGAAQGSADAGSLPKATVRQAGRRAGGAESRPQRVAEVSVCTPI